MNGLMAHCGSEITPLAVVMNAKTPRPTETHYPIPHGVLIESVRDQLSYRGHSIKEEAHAMTPDGDRYFGLLRLDADSEGYAPMVGIRNAHDKRLSAGLVVGSNVFVCDNLAFSGEVSMRRKHTRNILKDLPDLVIDLVERAGVYMTQQDDRIEAYKARSLPYKMADAFAVQMARDGVIPDSKVMAVVKEIHEPSHPEHNQGGTTVWTAFNAATEILKPKGLNQMNTLVGRTDKLHRLCDRTVGLAA